MLKLRYLLLITIIVVGCNTPQKIEGKLGPKSYSNPYEVFYAKLDNLKLTDTVLVQLQTKIFGCGTAAVQYYEDLEEKGLDKFYDQYGTLFSNTKLLKQFEKQNNTKILWIDVGQGDQFQLEDENLKSNDSLINRLRKEKDFITFEDALYSMHNLSATITISHPNIKTTEIKTYAIGLKHLGWTSTLAKEENRTGNNY